MRLIILKKSSIRRTLALSVLMILIGLSLINPFKAQATTPQDYLKPSTLIFYLYPHSSGMFWLESNPKLGYATLKEWNVLLPKGEMFVAAPENMQLASMGGLDRIGKYVQGKLMGRSYNGRYDKDIFKYRRTVTAEGVTDEVEVEIGKHFKDNDNLERLIGSVRKHLTTDAEETQDIKDIVVAPEPVADTKESQAAKIQILGGASLLTGLYMFGKILILCL